MRKSRREEQLLRAGAEENRKQLQLEHDRRSDKKKGQGRRENIKNKDRREEKT